MPKPLSPEAIIGSSSEAKAEIERLTSQAMSSVTENPTLLTSLLAIVAAEHGTRRVAGSAAQEAGLNVSDQLNSIEGEVKAAAARLAQGTLSGKPPEGLLKTYQQDTQGLLGSKPGLEGQLNQIEAVRAAIAGESKALGTFTRVLEGLAKADVPLRSPILGILARAAAVELPAPGSGEQDFLSRSLTGAVTSGRSQDFSPPVVTGVEVAKPRRRKASPAPERLNVTALMGELGVSASIGQKRGLERAVTQALDRLIEERKPTVAERKQAIELLVKGDVEARIGNTNVTVADLEKKAGPRGAVALNLFLGIRESLIDSRPETTAINHQAPTGRETPPARQLNLSFLAGALRTDSHGKWRAQGPGELIRETLGVKEHFRKKGKTGPRAVVFARNHDRAYSGVANDTLQLIKLADELGASNLGDLVLKAQRAGSELGHELTQKFIDPNLANLHPTKLSFLLDAIQLDLRNRSKPHNLAELAKFLQER